MNLEELEKYCKSKNWKISVQVIDNTSCLVIEKNEKYIEKFEIGMSFIDLYLKLLSSDEKEGVELFN